MDFYKGEGGVVGAIFMCFGWLGVMLVVWKNERFFKRFSKLFKKRFLYHLGDFCFGFWDVGCWGFSSKS